MLTHLHQQKQLMLLEAEAATMPYKTWIQENAREEKKNKPPTKYTVTRTKKQKETAVLVTLQWSMENREVKQRDQERRVGHNQVEGY